MKKIFLGFIMAATFLLFPMHFAVAKEPVDKTIVNLENPIKETVITTIVGKAIKVVTGIMGSLALMVFVYGGFRWLTAAGNSESVQAGTQAMVWASIGICIVFASYAILNLVFKGLGTAGEGNVVDLEKNWQWCLDSFDNDSKGCVKKEEINGKCAGTKFIDKESCVVMKDLTIKTGTPTVPIKF